jgi:hypothetical protein
METELLANIRAKLPELERLLQEMDSHWEYEDPFTASTIILTRFTGFRIKPGKSSTH